MFNYFKEWVLSWRFVQDNRAELYRKAFNDARADLEETNIYDVETKAEQMATERIAKMLGMFNEKLVVTQDVKKGLVYIGGQPVDNSRLSNLKSEAEYIETTDLWKIINNSLEMVTHKAMFEKSDFSKDMRDLNNGKSILYTLDFQRKILNLFKSYQQKPKSSLPKKGMV